jgi:hypothetical protein
MGDGETYRGSGDPLADLRKLFEDVQTCCLHNPVFTPDDVHHIVKWIGDETTGCDSQTIVLVRLKSEENDAWRAPWGWFTQGEDYTGHGCQCGAATVKGDTLQELARNMTDWDLETLITNADTRVVPDDF